MGATTSFHPEDKVKDLSIWELPLSHWSSWFFISEIFFQAAFFLTAAFGLGFNLLALFISTLSIAMPHGSAASISRSCMSLAMESLSTMISPRLFVPRIFLRVVWASSLHHTNYMMSFHVFIKYLVEE